MTVIVFTSVAGYLVIAGIFKYLPPPYILYSLHLQQLSQLIMVLNLMR
jgi:hypothetical protein